MSEPCVMCNGTGKDFVYINSEPDDAGIRTVIGKAEIDRPCRACLGTGKEDE